jgi:hypothetical protein
MPDKSPHQHEIKKSGKSIKQKRAIKRAKHDPGTDTDPVAHLKRK